MSQLTVKGLVKRFGKFAPVDGVTFTVDGGTIHSIIGPNGAGKTTLFNLLSGVLKPSAGSIRFDGAEIAGRPAHQVVRHGIARTFQNVQLFLNMTALENVLVGHHLHLSRGFLPVLFRTPHIRRSERAACELAAELMTYVGLAEHIKAEAANLPYGALKRLEIARALASRPKMLMLDEPAAGLNPAETEAIDELLKRIAADGITILLVEHDMRLVRGVSDHILVLERGRVLTSGTWDQIRHNPDVVEAYLGSEGRNL